jgi:hypothetical protein
VKSPQEIASKIALDPGTHSRQEQYEKIYIAIEERDKEHAAALEAICGKHETDCLELIDNRDEVQEAFDELVAMLEVDTEYSNMRGFAEILADCSSAIDHGVGKEWIAKHGNPAELRTEVERLREALNIPEIEDFDKAIPLEAAHQVQRWGVDHDSGKQPEDWFWLVGYLAGKALSAIKSDNAEKAKHHCISAAAALRNWHAHIRSGSSVMRPGIADPFAALAGDKKEPKS